MGTDTYIFDEIVKLKLASLNSFKEKEQQGKRLLSFCLKCQTTQSQN